MKLRSNLIAVGAVLALSLAGCKDKPAEGTGAATGTTGTTAAPATGTAKPADAPKPSGGKAEDRIIGQWTIDIDALTETDQFKNMPEEERKMALELAKGFMASMSFEITKDKFLVDAMGKKEEASYTVESSSGDELVLNTKESDGTEKKIKVTVKGADKLLLQMDEKDSLPLKKK